MSKHIQPISHYPPHERIKTFLIRKNSSRSNLTEGSAQSRLGAEAVEEGAKVSRIIIMVKGTKQGLKKYIFYNTGQ